MITKPGRQATKSDQLFYKLILDDPSVIVHHITEDTPYMVQLEVEYRTESGVSFKRVVIEG